jgi:hypothetical protein
MCRKWGGLRGVGVVGGGDAIGMPDEECRDLECREELWSSSSFALVQLGQATPYQPHNKWVIY